MPDVALAGSMLIKVAVRIFISREKLGMHLQKTRPAIYRSALRRIEWNGRESIAFRAMNRNLDFLFYSGFLCRQRGLDPFCLGLFARFAAFWRVLQSFITKEKLFAGRPNK